MAYFFFKLYCCKMYLIVTFHYTSTHIFDIINLIYFELRSVFVFLAITYV